MYCPHCGKQIDDKSEFCRFCGSKIRKIENKEAPKFQLDAFLNQIVKNNALIGGAVYLIICLMILICRDKEDSSSIVPMTFIIVGLVYPILAFWADYHLKNLPNRRYISKYFHWGIIAAAIVNCIIIIMGAIDDGDYDEYSPFLIFSPIVITGISLLFSYYKQKKI